MRGEQLNRPVEDPLPWRALILRPTR